MPIFTRRRVAGLVPWVALVAVTAFAFAQMHARVEAERGRADAGGVREVSESAGSSSATVVPEAAARAAESALDAALIDLEKARAELAACVRERDAALDRAESGEADLGIASARVDSLEAVVATAKEEAEAREAELEALRAKAAVHEDPVLGWLQDAGSEDAKRWERARGGATAATEEQVERLHELLAEDGTRWTPAARLLSSLPASDASDRLAVAILLAPAADRELLSITGPDPYRRVAVTEALLRDADPALAMEALGYVAVGEPAYGEEDRERLTAAVRDRLNRFEEAGIVLAVRATGLLRLPGLAGDLVVLTKHEGAAVRAAAAHALSLAPDLDTVRGKAVDRLSALLLDKSQDVRTAAVLLAEALLGEAVDFDPAAGEAVRREAARRILDQLD